MGDFEVTDDEIAAIGPILQRLMWASRETRARIQQYGANVLPINFYSSTPSIDEIEASFEYTSDQAPYLDSGLFNAALLRRTLEDLMPFASEFNPPAEGEQEACQKYFWQNGQFGYSDAMSYYCFTRLFKPATIVEIGSGFSTLIALEAVERNGRGQVHCIEPFPRPFLQSDSRVNLHAVRAQDITADFLNDLLRDGDFLFIDSTHTVKSGSDCLQIYLRLLPALRRDLFVHVHDVFLPFGMPKDWLLDMQNLLDRAISAARISDR